MKIILIALLLALPVLANDSFAGFCEQGARTVTTNGNSGAPRVQGSYPQCTITVYTSGTLSLATIYSDNSNTPKANPFVASVTGYWFFFANDARYDVQFSGGGLPSPWTLGGKILFDGINYLLPVHNAVARSIKAKLNDFISVKDFGALGDGSTNDEAAIAAALSGLSDFGGGTLYFPTSSGCYMAYEIRVPDNVQLLGWDACLKRIGRTATKQGGWGTPFITGITYDDDTGVSSAPSINVSIKGFTIDGNRANQSATSDGNLFNVAFFGYSNVVVDNITNLNAYTDGMYISGYGSHNLSVASNSSITVTNNVIRNSRRNNISIGVGDNIIIDSTVVDHANGVAPQAGIDVEPDYAGQVVKHVTLNVIATNNVGAGVNVFQPNMAGALIQGLSITGSFTNNAEGVNILTGTGAAALLSDVVVGGYFNNNSVGAVFFTNVINSTLNNFAINEAVRGIFIDGGNDNLKIGTGVITSSAQAIAISQVTNSNIKISDDCIIVSGTILDNGVATQFGPAHSSRNVAASSGQTTVYSATVGGSFDKAGVQAQITLGQHADSIGKVRTDTGAISSGLDNPSTSYRGNLFLRTRNTSQTLTDAIKIDGFQDSYFLGKIFANIGIWGAPTIFSGNTVPIAANSNLFTARISGEELLKFESDAGNGSYVAGGNFAHGYRAWGTTDSQAVEFGKWSAGGGYVRYGGFQGTGHLLLNSTGTDDLSGATLQVAGTVNSTGYLVGGVVGYSGTKTAGSCVLTIDHGIITNVTGC